MTERKVNKIADRIAANPVIKELRAEVAELKKALNGQPQDLDGWNLLPVEMRDKFAARALVQENGDWKAAMARLGFPAVRDRNDPGWKVMAATRTQIFDTPGVQAILRRTLDADEEKRKATIARLFEEVEFGPGDRAVRAAQPLAKLAGWIKDEPAPTQQVTIHLASLVGGAALEGNNMKRVRTVDQSQLPPSTEIASILTHDPGAPQVIVDEHASEAVLEIESRGSDDE